MSETKHSPVIVALDFNSATETLDLVELLSPRYCRLKVGKELFTIGGPPLVGALVSRGFDVFLDLKFHDIPNTVAGAVSAAADLGVWMVNVHASGGTRMMEAAKKAVDRSGHSVLLTAVTVLTSMDERDLQEQGIHESVAARVQRLAALAQHSGVDGVVCSAQEAPVIHANLGARFLTVTPGIRPASAKQDDQRRVVTPEQAKTLGVDYMVIGRPITQASNPLDALVACNNAFALA